MNMSGTAFAELAPRDRILRTAHDLFYADGIRATGIDKIIEASKVSKVTFYRQFSSKDELIRAYLAFRHELWMSWLRSSLEIRLAKGMTPMHTLLSTFEEWFNRDDFRGCAFLNSVAELGTTAPDILASVREHKAEMARAFEVLLPREPGRSRKTLALALAVDGAILHAQMGISVETVLEALRTLSTTALFD
jgi:AcrR family transcriptional regulator